MNADCRSTIPPSKWVLLVWLMNSRISVVSASAERWIFHFNQRTFAGGKVHGFVDFYFSVKYIKQEGAVFGGCFRQSNRFTVFQPQIHEPGVAPDLKRITIPLPAIFRQ